MAGEIRTLVGLAVESFIKAEQQARKWNKLATENKQMVRQLNEAERAQYETQTSAWLKEHPDSK